MDRMGQRNRSHCRPGTEAGPETETRVPKPEWDGPTGLLQVCRNSLVVSRCHKAKRFAQVDGSLLELPPPNTVVCRSAGDR